MSISERKKELRRRRKRREKFAHLKTKLGKMDGATKEKVASQLRKMTIGAEEVIQAWGLE
ncbi:MAG: hypothetical protein FWC43_05895 [Planctomycetaceae bacterium]|nr:hypothetical protein [Planctomycetaceae bacterium]